MTRPGPLARPTRAAATPGLEEAVTLYIGGLHATAAPALLRTTLGSCIAVCLWDPASRIGGMNHFLLPQGASRNGVETAYGCYAMDRLIGAMLKAGADRERLVASVFGGASLLGRSKGVAESNVRFAQSFLATEGLVCRQQDVGGAHPRHVRFWTATGLTEVRYPRHDPAGLRLTRLERWHQRLPPPQGTVTLF